MFAGLGCQIRIYGLNHLAPCQFRTAQPRQQVFHPIQAHVLAGRTQSLVRRPFANLGERRAGQLPTQFDKPGAVHFAQRPANGGFRLAGGGNIKPGGLGRLALGADDLDGLAVLDAGPKRHAHAVDLGPNAGVADPGVDGIGEIYWCGSARQFYNVALGRETEHLVGVHLKLDRLQKILVIFFGVKLFGQLCNPSGRVHRKGVFRPDAIAVRPMSRHAGFRHVVHLPRPDLDLDNLAIAP